MFDQIYAMLSTQGELATDTALSAAGREVLRRLAIQVAEKYAHTISNVPQRVVRGVESARQAAQAL